MTAFNGATSTNGNRSLTFSGLSNDLDENSFPVVFRVLHSSTEIRKGIKTAISPLGIAIALWGNYTPGIDQAAFGQILIWPTSLDLGLVLSPKTCHVGIWNLTGYVQRLTNWAVINLDGVAITNADGYPVSFGSDQYRVYQVDVAASGQASLNGSIAFNFVARPTVSVALSGTRLVVFSFEPNWREPPTENLEWLTDVLTAFNGREQRLQLRGNPRRALKYLMTFETKNKVATFESQVWGWQNLVFAVPVWTDWTRPTAAVSIGVITISVSTSLRDFAATRLALLWHDYRTWEVVEIQSLTSSQLTLTKATQQAWTTMDRIIPIRLGRMAGSLPVPRPTGTIAEASITFSLEPTSATDSTRLGSSSLTQYKGLDVLLVSPNAGDGLSDDFERNMPVIDFNKGAWDIHETTDAPVVKRPFRWVLKSRQEIMDLLKFLDNHKGRLVPFWVPTWSQDIELVQDIGASDLGIVVNSILYTQQIKSHPNRSDIILYPADGSVAPTLRGLTASSESVNNTEILTMDASLGTARTKDYFKAISFLTLCRFANDGFEIVWHSDSVAEVTVDLQEVLS
jgi:hypothetical protein